ncbi:MULTISPECIES: BlaI/MecI/CopY family transcriptional regulator [unclassified Pseudonocardia]|uniref:BlaI/MecI/CopY family transcriptional regulator n=1 Tax=unclassified Pseudonocardia TaxID=2619320 RepID=UPI0025E64E2E|nr:MULTISPECIES: BlaI/MecI/CopY family transcriptional regulator [unclassified Pseudonocardia]
MSGPRHPGQENHPSPGSLGLGELEMAVLEVLWQADAPSSARDVLTILTTRRTLAYTTVQTVLEKLRRKGWADRRPEGRAFLYTAAHSREEAAAQVLHSLLYTAPDVDAALLHFVRHVSPREQNVLRAALRNDD